MKKVYRENHYFKGEIGSSTTYMMKSYLQKNFVDSYIVLLLLVIMHRVLSKIEEKLT